MTEIGKPAVTFAICGVRLSGRPDGLPAELRARSAVLDGEIVTLDRHEKTQFKTLLFRRGEPRFYVFDLLWADSEDLRHLPLIDRKVRLRSLVPQRGQRLLYCDHVDGDGEKLFTFAGVDQLFCSARSTLLEPQS